MTEIISKRLDINFYHVRQQKEQKSRNAAAVSLKEKLNEYQEQNPDESFGAISELFSIKLQKKICRSMVGKYYRQIKAMKEKGVDLKDSETARVRKVSENILKFEKQFYASINES